MGIVIFSAAIQILLLSLLFAKDKYITEKELFHKQQWTISDIAITLLLMESYPFYFVLAAYLSSKFKIDLRSAILSLSESQLGFLTSLILLFLLLILFKLKFKKSIEILGINKNNLWENVYLGVFVGLICFLMVDGTIFLFSKTLTRAVEMVRGLRGPDDYLILFLGPVVLGPLVEEVAFRGILYSPFRKKYGPVKAIIIVSLIFALAHSHGGVLWIFFDGLFLTALYEKTESLIATFAAHSTINLLALIVALFVVG